MSVYTLASPYNRKQRGDSKNNTYISTLHALENLRDCGSISAQLVYTKSGRGTSQPNGNLTKHNADKHIHIKNFGFAKK